MDKFTVVDLFAGAGGLSLGFMQTGKFDIKVAFENNPNMQETYHKNHPDVDLRGDVCTADYKEICDKYGMIDIVIGGPPCQGFSNANRQRNHAISRNNILVKQYVRAILELNPKAFVMENVSMLRSDVHRFYLDKKDCQLIKQYDIPRKDSHILLLESDFMFDGALSVIKNNKNIIKYLWPSEHYLELNVIYKACKNPEKLTKTLQKHQKELLKYSQDHILNNPSKNYILNEGNKAFSAI
ncbi:DNA cytosine methyltransferase [Methanosarcinaceae archaeon]|nr:DNA cytosine methyltransferase [Methanosarcinaceae archaeon]